MNTTNIPGFVAERSLFGYGSRRVAVREGIHTDTIELQVVENGGVIGRRGSNSDFGNNVSGFGPVLAAAEPGGPGNVPVGYGRDCSRVPYTVCTGSRCHIEYAWVCTYYPLPRAQSSTR